MATLPTIVTNVEAVTQEEQVESSDEKKEEETEIKNINNCDDDVNNKIDKDESDDERNNDSDKNSSDDDVNLFDLQSKKKQKKKQKKNQKKKKIQTRKKISLQAGDFIAYYGEGGQGLVSIIDILTILFCNLFSCLIVCRLIDVSKQIFCGKNLRDQIKQRS